MNDASSAQSSEIRASSEARTRSGVWKYDPIRPGSNTLLSGLVGRKLDRAKINMKKGLFLEAKKNVDAILKVDPDNEEANEILNSIPAEY